LDRIGYEETLKVSYFQIDGNRNMSPAALLSCLQEAAVTHSDTIGYTLDYMAEHQWGWSVVNWHLQIYRMPQHGERIQVQTWSNKCMRFQAERSFFLFDERAINCWTARPAGYLWTLPDAAPQTHRMAWRSATIPVRSLQFPMKNFSCQRKRRATCFPPAPCPSPAGIRIPTATPITSNT
jgi:acyl-CoA thioesterase FadM